jgi:glyoxylate reductase
MQGER